MKHKLSTVVAIAISVLTVGVPTALADPAPAPDTLDRAAAAADLSGNVMPYLDAFERPAATQLQATAPDWFERASAIAVRNAATNRYVDASERPAAGLHVAASSPATISASGSDIAWGQIGLAFALGLLLAAGLGMAVRPTRRVDVVGHER